MNPTNLFSNSAVDFGILKKRAFNYRWAVIEDGIIPLTAADPDFQVAAPIVDAIKSYSEKGYFSYCPVEGLPEFKHAISQWYTKQHQSNVNSDLILPVNSAANALFIVAKAILNQFDEVLIPDPVDFLFRKSIENAGGKVIPCEVNSQSGNFDFDLLIEKITPRSKALFICNPNNPTGKAFSKEHLVQLIEFCKKHDLWLVSDEIWIDIYYQEPLTSILAIDSPKYYKKIVVSGLSKNFGLAGLRIGYLICQNEEHFSLMLAHSNHLSTAGGISSLAQVAGTAALNDSLYWLKEFRIHLEKMKQICEAFINEMPFLEIQKSDATYVLFPKIVNCSHSATSLVELILTEAKVALIPGGANWFEAGSAGHIRICFSTTEAVLQEAFSRIRAIQHSIR